MAAPDSDLPPRFHRARAAIFAAHNADPTTTTTTANNTTPVPYETHYAEQMESYLARRCPHASELLRLAVCAQHFRRWEVPRADFPMTKVGYHSWRAHLKKRQAALVGEVLAAEGYAGEEVERCRGLMEKEGLRQGGEEVVVLEDVACLVFLDDQFEEFRRKHDEEKIVGILRKTWGKMSERGREMALEIPMTDECKALVQKALEG